jgi:hypothetical protein
MNSKEILFKTCIILSIAVANLLSQPTFAFEVTHQLRPNSTYESTSLNNSCSTIEGSAFSSKCNPALFPYSKQEGITVSIIGKSDGDSIDNGRDLIFDPITETLLRRLFQETNFNSFTFNSDISFKNGLFEISYSPYYLLADLYLFNPAFPEISIQLVNRESLRLTSGTEISKFKLANNNYNFSVGSSIYYYEHTWSNTIFSLFDLSFNQPETLIQFQSEYGVAGDIGFFLNNDSFWLPKISMQVKNINSDLPINQNNAASATSQTSALLFDTYSTIGLGKDFKTQYGRFDLNLEIPFIKFYEEIFSDQIMLGGRYNLSLFSILAGFGKYYQNFGLMFNSEGFNIGITYTREGDMGDFQPSAEQSVYTGIDIIL